VWLAGPGVVVSTILTAVVLVYCVGYGDIFEWSDALMLGSVLAATDPVAVVALLKEVGASTKLATLIEGESLLNDGTAMVAFTGMFGLALGESLSVEDLTLLFVRLSFGGPLLGILFGMVVCFYLKRIFHDDMIEFTLLLTAAYISFYIAEETEVKVSGILTLVSLGLYMSAWGKYNIKVYSLEAVHSVWSFAAYASETMIFMLCGVLVGYHAQNLNIEGADIGKMLWFYVCMYIIRIMQLLVSYPILKYLAYGVSWRDAVIIIHGGMLRGAIGLILALIINVEKGLDDAVKSKSMYLMSGMAVLTLLINASTTSLLLNKLGLTRTSKNQETVLKEVIKKLDKETAHKINQLKQDRYHRGSEWRRVRELSGLSVFFSDVISNTTGGRAVISELLRNNESLNQLEEKFLESLDTSDSVSLQKEYRKRFVQTLKRFYLSYYEQGKCSQKTISTLVSSAEKALDDYEEVLCDWKYVKQSISNNIVTRILNKLRFLPFVKNMIDRRDYLHLAYSFDTCSTFIYCHAYTVDSLRDIIQTKRIHALEKIFIESKQQRKKCKNFIEKNIKMLFEDEMIDLQTKRTTRAVLDHQREVVNILYKDGVISDKEYLLMISPIDKRIHELQSHKYSQAYPATRLLVENSSLLKKFSPDVIQAFLLNSKSVTFNQGDTIYNLGDDLPGLFIILKGKILEKSKNGTTYIHEQDSIPGLHYYLTNLDTTDSFATALNTVYAKYIPKDNIMNAMDDEVVQEILWRCCLEVLIAINPERYRVIAGTLNKRNFKKLWKVCRFKNYVEGDTIYNETGAFLLKGQAECLGNTEDFKGIERSSSREKELENIVSNYNGCCYVAPNHMLVCKSNAIVLHFDHELYQAMQSKECSIEKALDMISQIPSSSFTFEREFSINQHESQESELISFY
jgi:NhaP-type Na+/H+ or K+/H+ antiporter